MWEVGDFLFTVQVTIRGKPFSMIYLSAKSVDYTKKTQAAQQNRPTSLSLKHAQKEPHKILSGAAKNIRLRRREKSNVRTSIGQIQRCSCWREEEIENHWPQNEHQGETTC